MTTEKHDNAKAAPVERRVRLDSPYGKDWLNCFLAKEGMGAVICEEQEINAAIEEIKRLRQGFERYETVRLLNPRAYQKAWQLNISSGKPFDEIIDELKPFVRPNA